MPWCWSLRRWLFDEQRVEEERHPLLGAQDLLCNLGRRAVEDEGSKVILPSPHKAVTVELSLEPLTKLERHWARMGHRIVNC